MTESVKVTVPPTAPSVRVSVIAPSANGLPGKDAYEEWLELPGNAGKTLDQFFAAFKGAPGTSFTVRGEVANAAALAGLTGVAAGDAYKTVDTGHLHAYTGTTWIDVGAITGGKDAYALWLELPGNAGKTLEQFFASFKGADATTLDADIIGGASITDIDAETDIVGGSLITDL